MPSATVINADEGTQDLVMIQIEIETRSGRRHGRRNGMYR
jgi:hypothetical protein